jgi:hypothetical protein
MFWGHVFFSINVVKKRLDRHNNIICLGFQMRGMSLKLGFHHMLVMAGEGIKWEGFDKK